jgi:hypothetical protein
MASVTGITAEYAQSILDGTIASAAIVDGALIFYKHDGSEFSAGQIGGGGTGGTGGGTTGGTVVPRADVSKTTASLADQASESGTITMATGYRISKIVTSVPARVRLYSTTAKRDADAARAIGEDPTGDHGLMLEYITATGLLSAALSPMVDGYSLEATPTKDIPYSITNLSGGSSPVTITLTWQKTE